MRDADAPAPRPPSRTTQRARRLAVIFFVLTFVALVWPVYPQFGGIAPTVLGVPFSLAYVVGWLLACFGVQLGLYLWESSRGELD